MYIWNQFKWFILNNENIFGWLLVLLGFMVYVHKIFVQKPVGCDNTVLMIRNHT